MATSIGFGEFADRMIFISEEVERNVEKAVQRAAIKADQAAVLATPVDTGRARGSWRVAIGTPRGVDIDPGLVGGALGSGEASIAQAVRTINSWRIGYGPIFITNGVPYILELDRGSSKQAPLGMSAAAIQVAKAELAKAKLLSGV